MFKGTKILFSMRLWIIDVIEKVCQALDSILKLLTSIETGFKTVLLRDIKE